MPCGSVVYFDTDTDAAVRGLWQVIDDAGLPSSILSLTYPPHLTLLACDEMGMDGLRKDIVDFVSTQPPLPVSFSGFGVFPGPLGVVYLAIIPDRALLDFHARLWDLARPHLQAGNSYYEPDSWVPHITLGYNLTPEQTGQVIGALGRAVWPRRGLLRELVLAGFAFNDDGVSTIDFEELFKGRLGGQQ